MDLRQLENFTVPELAVRYRPLPSVVIRPVFGEAPERTISLMKRRAVPFSHAANELIRLVAPFS